MDEKWRGRKVGPFVFFRGEIFHWQVKAHTCAVVVRVHLRPCVLGQVRYWSWRVCRRDEQAKKGRVEAGGNARAKVTSKRRKDPWFVGRRSKSRPLEGLAESHATGANFQPFLLVGPTRFFLFSIWKIWKWMIGALRDNLYTVMIYHGNLIL